jgi:hypothetical protein
MLRDNTPCAASTSVVRAWRAFAASGGDRREAKYELRCLGAGRGQNPHYVSKGANYPHFAVNGSGTHQKSQERFDDQ